MTDTSVHETHALTPSHLTEEATSWPILEPLVKRLSPLPTFDTSLIPGPLRSWITDAAQRLGVRPEMVYLPALVGAGIAIGNPSVIYPKAHDEDYFETSNLWGMIVAGPSTRKTASMREGLRYLSAIDAQARKEFRSLRSKSKAATAALDTQIKAQLKKLEAAEAAGDAVKTTAARERLDQLHEDRDKHQRSEPRLVVNDVTIEALLKIVSENPTGVLHFRDELAGMFERIDSVGHESDRPLLLEAYNPRAEFTMDRISRDSVHAQIVTLALLGGIQPERLAPMMKQSVDKGGHDGFLARFQFVVRAELQGLPSPIDRAPDTAARERAESIYQALHQRTKTLVANDPWSVEGVHLDVVAQRHMDDWRTKIDKRIRAANDRGATAVEAHLGKTYGAAMRLALILHLIERVDGHPSPSVAEEQAKRATETMEFFLAHALSLYEGDAGTTWVDVEYLATKITDGVVYDGMNTREASQKLSRLSTKPRLTAALETLTSFGWVRVEEVPNTGARPSTIIRLHPDLVRGASSEGEHPLVS